MDNRKLKIGLISDTHGYMDDRILHHLRACDEIWHIGDVGDPVVLDQLNATSKLQGVYGNIDGTKTRKRLPEFLVIDLQGFKFLLIHIAGPLGKYTPQTRALIEATQPDALVCGHSHILRVKRDDRFKLMYINPGAAGRHGFHKVRTICTFEMEAGEMKNFQVVELGPRSAKTVD